jgi:hypothetical protein
MKQKCIIICNGPSVQDILSHKFNYSEYDIIAVNRWNNIFTKLKLPNPNIVIIGKNTLEYNIPYIKQYPNIKFVGIDTYPSSNYSLLKFGKHKCYNQDIIMLDAMWWTGVYAIQYALQNEYDEINIFGFTCTNVCDYKDTFRRAHIPYNKVLRMQKYFQYLENMNILNNTNLYESNPDHLLINYFPNNHIIKLVPLLK